MSGVFDRSRLLRASTLVSIATLASGIVSFVNQAVLARLFGSGSQMESYLVGISLPLLATGLLGSLVSYSIVPILLHSKLEGQPRGALEAWLFWILALGSGLLGMFGALFAPAIVNAVAPTLTPEVHDMATAVARLAWVSFLMNTLTNFNGAVLNAQAIFLRPALANMGPVLGAIAGALALGHRLGPIGVAIGGVAGAGVAFVCLLPGVTIRMSRSDEARRFAFAALAQTPLILASMALFTIYGTVDAAFATRVGPSTIAYLGYCQRVLIGLGALVTAGPFAVVLPLLSKLYSDGEHVEFRRVIGRSVKTVLTMSSGLAVVVGFLRVPVIHVLLERGKFTSADTAAMSGVFGFYLIGMVPMLATSIVFSALYARRALAVSAAIGLSGAVGYALLAGVLGLRIGLLGFGIAYVINWTVMLLVSIRAIWGQGILPRIARQQGPYFLELVPALIVAGAIARAIDWVGTQSMPSGILGAFFTSSIGCFLGYGAFLAVCVRVAPNGIISTLIARLRQRRPGRSIEGV